jgi:drug/metabolite transporter (DMT)-like permease
MSEGTETAPLRPLYPVLILLGASVLWGLTWLPLKYFGRHGLEGAIVTLGAHGSVGVFALGWLVRSRRGWLPAWRGVLSLIFFGGLANLAFASAIVAGDVVRVMVLFYLLPVWGVLGGALLLGERVDGLRKVSVAAALGGAFLILGGFGIATSRPSMVDLLAVVAGMALALNNVLFRKLASVGVADKVAAMFVGCLLWAAALTALDPQAVPRGVPSVVWIQLITFGLVWVFVATVGTLWGVAHMEAGRSSVLIIMELLTAVASAAILNGTRLRPVEWLGGALIVAAAILEARRPSEA